VTFPHAGPPHGPFCWISERSNRSWARAIVRRFGGASPTTLGRDTRRGPPAHPLGRVASRRRVQPAPPLVPLAEPEAIEAEFQVAGLGWRNIWREILLRHGTNHFDCGPNDSATGPRTRKPTSTWSAECSIAFTRSLTQGPTGCRPSSIFPISKGEGGRESVDNAVLAHRLCNRIDYSYPLGGHTGKISRESEKLVKRPPGAVRACRLNRTSIESATTELSFSQTASLHPGPFCRPRREPLSSALVRGRPPAQAVLLGEARNALAVHLESMLCRDGA
jgi:hypothetical protein